MEIQFLPGVGPKRAELMRKELGVSTVGELLRLYPFRYIDRSSYNRIADARPDMAYVQVRATVMRVDLHGAAGGNGVPYGNAPVADGRSVGDGSGIKFNAVKRMSVWVEDGTGEMEMVFFKGIKWMHEKLRPGLTFIFFGKPAAFNGKINIVHPEVDACPAGAGKQSVGGQSTIGRQGAGGQDVGGTMTGVYTSTDKLKNSGITGKIMTKIMYLIPSDLTIRKVRIGPECIEGGDASVVRDPAHPREKLCGKK